METETNSVSDTSIIKAPLNQSHVDNARFSVATAQIKEENQQKFFMEKESDGIPSTKSEKKSPSAQTPNDGILGGLRSRNFSLNSNPQDQNKNEL